MFIATFCVLMGISLTFILVLIVSTYYMVKINKYVRMSLCEILTITTMQTLTASNYKIKLNNTIPKRKDRLKKNV